MNPSALPARGPLTDGLVDTLTDTLEGLVVIGDGTKPKAGGWADQPQEGDFANYATVATGVARPAPGERQSLAGQHLAWVCTYPLTSVGATRQQADYTADLVRAAALTYAERSPLTLGVEDWAIESITFEILAGVDRNDATDPPTWSVADQASIRITRANKRSV